MSPKRMFFSLFVFLLSFTSGYSQSNKIEEYLRMVREGKISEVKMILPDLLAEYPNDPGIQLLHASVLDDANRAVEIYEKIIRSFPQSEFAAECYWRIIQYFALKGEVERASRELENFRKAFPNSNFLTPASDLVRTAIALARVSPRIKIASNKEKDTIKIPQNIEDEKPTTKKGTYGLQVGLYSTIESAKSEVERFRSMRLRAEIFTKRIDSGTLMYAVVIGDYPTREKAEVEKPIVQEKCGCTPIIFPK